MTVSGAAVTAVRPEEQKAARRWFQRHWARAKPAPAPVGLLVLANHDPVIRNGRGGRPLKIAGKQYRRGLYCLSLIHISEPTRPY